MYFTYSSRIIGSFPLRLRITLKTSKIIYSCTNYGKCLISRPWTILSRHFKRILMSKTTTLRCKTISFFVENLKTRRERFIPTRHSAIAALTLSTFSNFASRRRTLFEITLLGVRQKILAGARHSTRPVYGCVRTLLSVFKRHGRHAFIPSDAIVEVLPKTVWE